ncbi:5-(carboxyamino)imidazole ribonucleotide synthase [Hyphomonas johnsonii]|uniref:N5-carboxyaminoimidazole ribonucleotide synthase n=1 Tax=Hyphomonas johnsonii MHS-2 TaxID=1280950 RepID=A0A059FMG5_9PROT|nr:5-(carboxyamino)imidazole ribonucleotide synthase [Hyphomonas johnsonii]KCZ91865.1 phosphoribosylaminoimidazole carboxylase ATPase subunit [Hyphomonas johnsonii MHS-2]
MTALPPGTVIGILGGGQLGRMLAAAASQLGFDVHVFCPEADAPAARVAMKHWQADYTDDAALSGFARACSVVTLEFENIPVSTVEAIAATGTPLHPGAKSLAVSQDRADEKAFLNGIGISTADYRVIAAEADIAPALAALGGKGVLKTRRDGYDGKGQAWLKGEADIAAGWESVGRAPSVLEAAIAFDREISVIVARSSTGETASWAPPRNVHDNGILAQSVVPSGLDRAIEIEARRQAVALVDALGHVGVLALEFFVMADGSLIANEFAPRVHNSGHWTPEACQTGQFEQHIRAIAGWKLGDTHRLFDAEMINLIGEAGHVDPAGLAANETLTLYGKREARAGRKMGHITRRLDPRKD